MHLFALFQGYHRLTAHTVHRVRYHLAWSIDSGASLEIIGRIINVAHHSVAASTAHIEAYVVYLQFCADVGFQSEVDITLWVVVNLAVRPLVASQKVTLCFAVGSISCWYAVRILCIVCAVAVLAAFWCRIFLHVHVRP